MPSNNPIGQATNQPAAPIQASIQAVWGRPSRQATIIIAASDSAPNVDADIAGWNGNASWAAAQACNDAGTADTLANNI